MPEAWRIVKTAHAPSAFTGEGARLFGGRGTSQGRRAVYTSATVALAMLEMLVHLEAPHFLSLYTLFPVTIPDDLVEVLDPASLPAGWRSYPAPPALQRLGDHWLSSARSAVLRVPSVIVPTEFNFILNPGHPAFSHIRVGRARPWRPDPRLGRR